MSSCSPLTGLARRGKSRCVTTTVAIRWEQQQSVAAAAAAVVVVVVVVETVAAGRVVVVVDAVAVERSCSRRVPAAGCRTRPFLTWPAVAAVVVVVVAVAGIG